MTSPPPGHEPAGTDRLEILWDCHDCGKIFWQDEHENEPDPDGEKGDERSTCPFCGSHDGAGVMNSNEPVNRDSLEDFARRERRFAWEEGYQTAHDVEYGPLDWKPRNPYAP